MIDVLRMGNCVIQQYVRYEAVRKHWQLSGYGRKVLIGNAWECHLLGPPLYEAVISLHIYRTILKPRPPACCAVHILRKAFARVIHRQRLPGRASSNHQDCHRTLPFSHACPRYKWLVPEMPKYSQHINTNSLIRQWLSSPLLTGPREHPLFEAAEKDDTSYGIYENRINPFPPNSPRFQLSHEGFIRTSIWP